MFLCGWPVHDMTVLPRPELELSRVRIPDKLFGIRRLRPPAKFPRSRRIDSLVDPRRRFRHRRTPLARTTPARVPALPAAR